MLNEEQTEKIKTHLSKQLENFPENQRELIKEKINAMSPEEMEIFLKDNQLNYEKNDKEDSPCIFCLIAEKKLKSYILEENEKFIAVLEINPLSKAHTLIIPKKHLSLEKIKELPKELIENISNKIKNKFKTGEVKLEKSEIQGHAVINLIPIYKSTKLERNKISDMDLQTIQKELTTEEKEKPKVEIKKEDRLKETNLEKIKLRIP